MLPTDFGSSVSEIIPQVWSWLVASCITVNIDGVIIIPICIITICCS